MNNDALYELYIFNYPLNTDLNGITILWCIDCGSPHADNGGGKAKLDKVVKHDGKETYNSNKEAAGANQGRDDPSAHHWT